MGGLGSGAFRLHPLVEDFSRLDIGHVRRAHRERTGAIVHCGLASIDGKPSGELLIRVHGTHAEAIFSWGTGGIVERRSLPFERVAIPRGGSRWWWLCPRCRGRALHLYASERLFICRRCVGAVYTCQRESALGRAVRRLTRKRHALGPLAHRDMKKPARMHWKTFARRMHDLVEAEVAVNYLTRAEVEILFALRERLLGEGPAVERKSRPLSRPSASCTRAPSL